MAHFLLVHGSCHGGWCWEQLTPALAAFGHTASTPDLPGAGRDAPDRDQVTLADYAAALRAEITEPVIMLGHSAAGYAITAAAEADPAGIRALIYLCAYRPQDGLSLVDMRRAAPRQTLQGALRVTGGSYTFDPARAADLLCHDCPPAVAEAVLARLVPQPIAPQATPLALSAGSQDLPQAYICCTEDRLIPPEHQMLMAKGLPEGAVHTLPSSHAPYYAMPERLAALLDQIAAGLSQ